MPVTGSNGMITPEEKQQVLHDLLASQTFNRCEQLKRILAYLCAKESDGRSTEITEYLIGVEALGRSQDFSTSDDSSVRSRVHALRKKLQEYYLVEAPEAALRVEIPTRSYSPQFTRVPAAPHVTRVFQEIHRPPTFWQKPHGWLTFLAGVLATVAIGFTLRQPLALAITRWSIPFVIRQAWGPLLQGDEVLVVIATPPQLILRDYAGMPLPSSPPWTPEFRTTPELLAFYGQRLPVSPQTTLTFHPNQSSPLWGDVAAMASAVAALAGYHSAYRVVPERLLQPYMLRNRNVLLFGRPEYSPAIRLLLKDTPFVVEYNSELRSWGVRNRTPKTGEPAFYASRANAAGLMSQVPGLLTVLPSEAPVGEAKRTVIFSGATTAGALGAEEFFSTPRSLENLGARFRKEGLPRWPQSWQLVLQTDVANDSTLPLRSVYEAHRVLEK